VSRPLSYWILRNEANLSEWWSRSTSRYVQAAFDLISLGLGSKQAQKPELLDMTPTKGPTNSTVANQAAASNKACELCAGGALFESWYTQRLGWVGFVAVLFSIPMKMTEKYQRRTQPPPDLSSAIHFHPLLRYCTRQCAILTDNTR